MIEASYEGTFASNLPYNKPSSKGVPSTYYNFTQRRDDTNTNWLNANLPNPFYGVTTSGTVPSNANAIYPDSVRNNTVLWTWMSTNTLFTGTNRSRSNVLFGTPNGTVNVPEPRFHSRTAVDHPQLQPPLLPGFYRKRLLHMAVPEAGYRLLPRIGVRTTPHCRRRRIGTPSAAATRTG